jgi:hypothetical protein
MNNGSCNGNNHSSSHSTSLTEGEFNSSMHINRMFDETSENVNIHLEFLIRNFFIDFFRLMLMEMKKII